MRRYALRDDQWDRIKDILPGREGHVGGTAADNRVFVAALVLSLLLSEVKTSFDTFDARVRAFAGDLTNLDTHLAQNTIAWPLMLAMCAWLAVIFTVFGLLSPRNAVVHLSIVVCALCVASAVFLINDFDSPLDGVMHISSQPMRDTLGHIDESG